jgi:hypothetical protein
MRLLLPRLAFSWFAREIRIAEAFTALTADAATRGCAISFLTIASVVIQRSLLFLYTLSIVIQGGMTCLFNFGQFLRIAIRLGDLHSPSLMTPSSILTQFMTIDLTIANNWRIYWTDMKKVAASNLRAVSLFRGLYARVARNLDMDVSYISRIARGERRSKIVEDALNREVIKILKMLKSDSRSPKQTTKNVDQGR